MCNTDTLKTCRLCAQFKASHPSCRLPSNEILCCKLKWYQGTKTTREEINSAVMEADSLDAAWFYAAALCRKTATRGPRRSHWNELGTTSSGRLYLMQKYDKNFIQCAAMIHLSNNILWHMQLEIMVTYWNRLYCYTHTEYFIILALQIVPRIWLRVLP